MSYACEMWMTLGVISLLWLMTFGFESPGYLAIGCLGLVIAYIGHSVQERRNGN